MLWHMKCAVSLNQMNLQGLSSGPDSSPVVGELRAAWLDANKKEDDNVAFTACML